MDEALAQVSIDFSGRPSLQWQVQFLQNLLGIFPTQMAEHFFKSFSDAAACNLQISVTGSNDHHVLESCFKAFARCLRQATDFSSRINELPSTKGAL